MKKFWFYEKMKDDFFFPHEEYFFHSWKKFTSIFLLLIQLHVMHFLILHFCFSIDKVLFNF